MGTRTLTVEVDELDYNAIQRAIAIRQTMRIWPEAPEDPDIGESSLGGLALAEICRGWLDMLGKPTK